MQIQPFRRLLPGEALYQIGDPATLWQLEYGAIRLDAPTCEGQTVFTQLALPGHLLGVETFAALPHRETARAIVPCYVTRRVVTGDAGRHITMLEALIQAQKRSSDMAALRSGPTPERLKQLLVLLATIDQERRSDARPLPTIRDMAAILDTTKETISRILASMRRAQVLESRGRQGASYDVHRLRDIDSSSIQRPRVDRLAISSAAPTDLMESRASCP